MATTQAINIVVYIAIGAAVFISSLVTGTSNVYKPIVNIFGQVFQIQAGVLDTSKLVEVCSAFHQDIFRLDLYESAYLGKFSGNINYGLSDYRKMTALCGALIEIVDAASTGKNMTRTVQEINEDYSQVYPGFEIDSESISESVGKGEMKVWQDEVLTLIKDEVDRRILE